MGHFNIDNLSLIMMELVGLIGLSIASFSKRYLKGDIKQGDFFLSLTLLILNIFIMVSANHLLIFFVSWVISNLLLARVMLHKSEWSAAKYSSILAMKNFGLGTVLLGGAFALLYVATGEANITEIIGKPITTVWAVSSCFLIILAAMIQSALWPFHRWLISSLNSPTPVSAIMHAGLINGGGFLLARFAPILVKQPETLSIIFAAGILTAMLGTFWKLMQNDIKRMLACSTMGQMGFMIAQCGLGLFSAAVAHLCWHGFFKAYLFLGSGSAAQEKRLDLKYPPSLKQFFLALFCGALGMLMFSLASEKKIISHDTTIFLNVLAMLAGTQFSLSIIRSHLMARFPLCILLTMCGGFFYGFSVSLIEKLLGPLSVNNPQPLNLIHFLGLFIMIGGWISMLFFSKEKNKQYPDWMLRIYVWMLNASQPHPQTITTHRNQYKF